MKKLLFIIFMLFSTVAFCQKVDTVIVEVQLESPLVSDSLNRKPRFKILQATKTQNGYMSKDQVVQLEAVLQDAVKVNQHVSKIASLEEQIKALKIVVDSREWRISQLEFNYLLLSGEIDRVKVRSNAHKEAMEVLLKTLINIHQN